MLFVRSLRFNPIAHVVVRIVVCVEEVILDGPIVVRERFQMVRADEPLVVLD